MIQQKLQKLKIHREHHHSFQRFRFHFRRSTSEYSCTNRPQLNRICQAILVALVHERVYLETSLNGF